MDVLDYFRDTGDGGNDDDDDDDDVTSKKGHRHFKHHAIANAIVIPQTALEECRHRSLVMYTRATDLVRSSSSTSTTTTTTSSSGGIKKNGGGSRRCDIVFADVHHVDTQINSRLPPPPADAVAVAVASNDGEEDESAAASASASAGGGTINDENDARQSNTAPR